MVLVVNAVVVIVDKLNISFDLFPKSASLKIERGFSRCNKNCLYMVEDLVDGWRPNRSIKVELTASNRRSAEP
ncbi:hypothetical protein C0V75_20825 [Tabrizicola sp. TH137]|nr:hypothetical protein C0V75_20825 [Tabrizicola sp. TH137]